MGSTSNPQIHGSVSAASLKVKGTEWQSLLTGLDASPSHVALSNGDLRPAKHGRITFNVDVGLDHWAFRDTNPVQINASVSQVQIADIRDLAGSTAPVTGVVSGNVTLRGSLRNPLGNGSLVLTDGVVADEPIQSAKLTFEGAGSEIHVKADAKLAGGEAQATGTWFTASQRYEVQAKATGIRIAQFNALKKGSLAISGVAALTAKGSGTLADPAFHLTIEVPQLKVQSETVNGLVVEADVANNVADVSVDSRVMGNFVRAHGKVNLKEPYQTEAVIDTSTISLQPLVAAWFPAQVNELSGLAEVHATLRGPLKDSGLVDAHISLPVLSLSYQKGKVEIAAASPIQMDYTHGVLTLQKATIRGTGTDLTLQGTIPLTGTAPIAVAALGTIDLRLAALVNSDLTGTGQIQFNVDGSGPRSNPNVKGQVKLVNAGFSGVDLPLGLQNANGVLNLTSDRLEIVKLDGTAGGGNLTATGSVTYRPALKFDLAVAANGIRLLIPQGVREGVDANLTLTGSAESALLSGQVSINELSFSPAFDLADIIGQLDMPSTAPPEVFARNLALDIRVQSTSDLSMASGKFSIEGAANLRVRGTAADPVVLGRVTLSGGDLMFNGGRYLLLPSTLDFNNPYRIEPRVNISVDTTVQEYNVHLHFIGPVDQLRTTFSSEPALPPSDIINLLAFGKTDAVSAANPAGNLGARSMVASSVSSQLTSRLEKVAGISQLSVDPVLGGNQQSSGARITIQQKVTANLFVTFATDSTSTQQSVVKLEYQATPRISFSGVRDQNGGFALDLRFRKVW